MSLQESRDKVSRELRDQPLNAEDQHNSLQRAPDVFFRAQQFKWLETNDGQCNGTKFEVRSGRLKLEICSTDSLTGYTQPVKQ